MLSFGLVFLPKSFILSAIKKKGDSKNYKLQLIYTFADKSC